MTRLTLAQVRCDDGSQCHRVMDPAPGTRTPQSLGIHPTRSPRRRTAACHSSPRGRNFGPGNVSTSYSRYPGERVCLHGSACLKRDGVHVRIGGGGQVGDLLRREKHRVLELAVNEEAAPWGATPMRRQLSRRALSPPPIPPLRAARSGSSSCSPVISAIPFTDIDEVIGRANATLFGLGSGVWTRDVSKAHRLAKGIRAGSVWVTATRPWIRRCPSVGTR
jgi:hypothetical protein